MVIRVMQFNVFIQEAKLKKIRAMRGQVDYSKLINGNLCKLNTVEMMSMDYMHCSLCLHIKRTMQHEFNLLK